MNTTLSSTNNDGERAKPAAVVVEPPVSNTGGKCPNAALAASEGHASTRILIDWLRLSGPRASVNAARRILVKHLGDLTPGKGRFIGLDLGEHIGTAGLFYSTDPSVHHCVIELPATALAEIDPAVQLTLANELLWHGFKATRLDIAIDFYDRPDLIEQITTSCDLGELCHARRYTPVSTHSNQHLIAHGINIGARGKNGSGRYLRVYDKSLEQQRGEPGSWVRWEAELSDDVAAASLREILSVPAPFDTARRIALGVCDFRSVGGHRSASRRPRARWFTEFLAGLEQIRFVVSRPDPTPTTYVRWMAKAVLPKMRTIAAASTGSLEAFADQVAPEVRPNETYLGDAVVRGYLYAMDIPADLARSRIRLGCTP